jgi:hypothetical protein
MANDFAEASGWRAHVELAEMGLLDRDIGTPILADMVAGCPVDTGDLVGSLDKEVFTSVLGPTLRVGSRDKDYSLYVEEGHLSAYAGPGGITVYTGGFVEPQPFMKPALFRQRGA